MPEFDELDAEEEDFSTDDGEVDQDSEAEDVAAQLASVGNWCSLSGISFFVSRAYIPNVLAALKEAEGKNNTPDLVLRIGNSEIRRYQMSRQEIREFRFDLAEESILKGWFEVDAGEHEEKTETGS